MARGKQGWSLYRTPHGTYHVRFRHKGTRYKVTTGKRDRDAAQVAAARIYEETIAGGRPAPVGNLAALVGDWIDQRRPELSPHTWEMYMMHWEVHLLPYFRTMDAITPRTIDAYVAHRLGLVKRKTVVKELSTLRQFVKWAHRRGDIPHMIDVRTPGNRVIGTVASPRQRVELDRDQMEALLEALPERTRRYGNPARALFTVMWETGLRVGTLMRIEAPFDYRRGGTSLRIRPEIDKARFDRTLPLSTRARKALDSVCPDEGIIFPPADYRTTLKSAGRRAGLSDEDVRFLNYHDIRHAALMDLGSSTTDLTAIAYIAGHKHIVTTAKYVRGREQGAADAMAARQTTRPGEAGKGE